MTECPRHVQYQQSASGLVTLPLSRVQCGSPKALLPTSLPHYPVQHPLPTVHVRARRTGSNAARLRGSEDDAHLPGALDRGAAHLMALSRSRAPLSPAEAGSGATVGARRAGTVSVAAITPRLQRCAARLMGSVQRARICNGLTRAPVAIPTARARSLDGLRRHVAGSIATLAPVAQAVCM